MKHSLIHPFEERTLEFICQHKLISDGYHILAAVSGGADSVALLNVLVCLRGALGAKKITVVHFNHRLRGAESNADEEFVLMLAGRCSLPFQSKSEDVRKYQKRHKVSLEMAARSCRHRFFEEALDRLGAQVVALGHTSNDQVEEVLLRLIRGTGPSGLAGMLPKTKKGIIRPLLFATRQEINSYLTDKKLSHRTDWSNSEPFCQRNVLRLDILPILKRRFHPAVTESIYRHTRLAQDDEDYWALQVRKVWPALCLRQTDSKIALRLADTLNLHPALQRRVFRYAIERIKKSLLGVYAVHIESLCRWINKGTSGSAIQLPRDVWVMKEAGTLFFSEGDFRRQRRSFNPCPYTISEPGEYLFSSFHLRLCLAEIGTLSGNPPTTPELFWLDAERLTWPLVVRSRNPGDRFQPFGLRGRKKLQDFFVDSKIPKSARDSIPLLCDQEKICCVMGFRLDGRVKVTGQTKHVLVVEIKKVEQV